MSEEGMPENYTPAPLRAPVSAKRESVAYACGWKGSVLSGQYWAGPFAKLQEALDKVPETNARDAAIIRFNLDGSNEVVYEWKLSRDARPPRWVRSKV